MSRRPLIALTSTPEGGSFRVPARYFEAVWDAGAMPSALPTVADWKRIEEYADLFDGFLFTGGGDVDPKYYGEEPSPKLGEVSEERDAFEFALLSSVMIREKPVLGVCRGEQLLNVGLGGSLFQHIEGHARTSPDGPWIWHGVTVKPGTLLAEITGSGELRVNSSHHQAVKAEAKPLRVNVVNEEGITEGFELPGHPFFLGVQWHPEVYYKEDEKAAAIFRAFAESCRRKDGAR